MNQIVQAVEAVLRDVRVHLPPENVNDARDLIEHDEFGEALDLVCTQLYELEIPITVELYERIRALASAMELDASTWSFLEPLVIRR